MKKLLFIIGIVIFGLVVVTASILHENGKTSTTTITQTTLINSTEANDVRVEVYHFHRTQQCWSCKTVGAFAEKTVNTYFKQGLESGKIKFANVNIELPENAELTNKYGATGSSLMIGVYKDGVFHKEENVNVWYKLNNEEDYLSYLKGILEKRLTGDFS